MTWVAVAVAGGAIVGGVITSQGAKSAANTQADAAMNAAQLTQNQWQTINQQEQPFMQGGYGALNQLNYLLGIGTPQQYATQSYAPSSAPPAGTYGGQPMGRFGQAGNGFMGVQNNEQVDQGMTVDLNGNAVPSGNLPVATSTPYSTPAGGFGSLVSPFTVDTFHQYSPAYDFQRQQGMQGVLGADASSAGALSGAAQKDLISYNQNMANTAFNNAFNQYQTQQGNIYTRLAGIANLGQNAATNTGQTGANLAASSAQSITNAGTAAAAGQVGAANAIAGGINSAVPWLMASRSGGGSFSMPSNPQQSFVGNDVYAGGY